MKNSITDYDHTFALEIASEFKIPLQDLEQIINMIRAWKQAGPLKPDTPLGRRNKTEADLIKILDSTGFKVTKIHLETPNDVIHLSEDDPLFYFFNRSIKLFRDNFRKEIFSVDKKWIRYINSWGERQIFKYFIKYFRNHNLKVFDQRAIIGLFLCHFEIYRRKPIIAQDHNKKFYRYLNNNIVKNLHNKYLKEFPP